MTKWNRKYGEAGTRLFGDAPNTLIATQVPHLHPRPQTVLCLADGDGRDGTWLAQQGFAVTAVDLSEVGTVQARHHDQVAGVTVHRIVADLADWQPPRTQRWDLITMSFLQCESAVRQRVVQQVRHWLQPGGYCLIEGFSSQGLTANTEGPKDSDLLYDRETVQNWLEGLIIHLCEDAQVELDQGISHVGTGHVIRVCAQQPT